MLKFMGVFRIVSTSIVFPVNSEGSIRETEISPIYAQIMIAYQRQRAAETVL